MAALNQSLRYRDYVELSFYIRFSSKRGDDVWAEFISHKV